MIQSLSLGESLQWEKKPYGWVSFVSMTTAPYPHESRMEGYKSGTTVYSFEEHYNNSSVAIILPENYRIGSKVNLIIHFHGHQQDLARVLSVYQLAEQLNASGKNAVLVIPQGPLWVPDSEFGKLDTKNGFKNFIDELMGLISNDEKIWKGKKKLELGDIILTGHSGGYYTIGQILSQGGMTKNIKEVYLLDATYGQLDKYTAWLKRYKGRLMSIFTAHLAMENVEFIIELSQSKIRYGLLREKEVTKSDLKGYRVLFLPTEIEHDQVPYESRLVERFLKTSILPDCK